MSKVGFELGSQKWRLISLTCGPSQSGEFWIFLTTYNFLTKVAQVFNAFWGIYKKVTFQSKPAVASFRATFGWFGLLFIPTSGHHVARLVLSAKKLCLLFPTWYSLTSITFTSMKLFKYTPCIKTWELPLLWDWNSFPGTTNSKLKTIGVLGRSFIT